MSVARRVFMLGATGTIGQATVRALVARGHQVVCFVRTRSTHRVSTGGQDPVTALCQLPGVELRSGDPLCADSLQRDGLRGERFDVWVSCLASRTGAPADAWAVDHRAHQQVLQACQDAGVNQVVLLSAICVQKPLLAFQQAKLAFESSLIASGLNYSIVRPTAFFKSLSGQFERVRQGKPFLLFGDGTLTACKPIADEDLADYLADCLTDPSRHWRVLPIGGPGPALTPREQGRMLFEALGMTPRFRSVPVGFMDAIIRVMSLLGVLWPAAAAKAEFARIGRYYATESMLVWDPRTGHYQADSTPETGSRTLGDHYRAMARGEVGDQRGEHAVF